MTTDATIISSSCLGTSSPNTELSYKDTFTIQKTSKEFLEEVAALIDFLLYLTSEVLLVMRQMEDDGGQMMRNATQFFMVAQRLAKLLHWRTDELKPVRQVARNVYIEELLHANTQHELDISQNIARLIRILPEGEQ